MNVDLGELADPKFASNSTFTELEVAKFNEVFAFFDRYGNGTMDVRDLPKALRATGVLVTDEELKFLIDKYDPTATGFISFADFQLCVGQVQNKPDSALRV